ncbi:hypothetical protein BY996DRAFT_6528376 [Phakopsora pachyrhizi]|uniref:Uncharacterized protein n=1 Tax=Phakopsora pachyrhizi TaxID=170000 RepID=A0AAV0B5S0_PHAPC|nr:hypothetical protein BY996DRAFT_6528376 [Phakopsora pachyrhizi]CAH7682259.1 hypothetical protein PPACK8108_LOCUS15066 [Phakopsora pachyrhizi]
MPPLPRLIDIFGYNTGQPTCGGYGFEFGFAVGTDSNSLCVFKLNGWDGLGK